ncbi:EEIG1/EHBP1 N-terminal domain containing protein [Parasponia andersonii]|uniref:EEIG1/EHBP1 N-terminal domain containing protein n=1 Tax=Parasponia andersonii TaxID=3476 RepID=A0A2P5BDY5_PARAD|nr:EEIG1/EHBP1 N-terminal domain containing protein [Parasponia andersonii]
MADENSGRRSSNTQLLEELEALSQSLYQSHTAAATRRTASLVLPRSSIPPISSNDEIGGAGVAAKTEAARANNRPRRRLSLSPWRSRPKLDDENDQPYNNPARESNQRELKKLDNKPTSEEKKGIWKWKPIRALSHIGMQKLSCLFSVEVVTAQNLPASMNGLRLSVCVRKKETKDGSVQTMPSRVSQGAADFEETLFVRCHVYCSHGSGKQLKLEPRPFRIYAFAVDADELDFGRSTIDLSQLIQESIDKSHEGTRVRQWDTSFNLSGKAKGGELVLKLGFQILEKDGGIGIYSQAEEVKTGNTKSKTLSSASFARKQSKTSFSVPSPKLSSRKEARTPSQTGTTAADLHGIDDLNLDEPAPVPTIEKPKEPDTKAEDLDLPDFEVVDKGVEFQENEKDEEEEQQSVKSTGERSTGSEVVKEIVHGQLHNTRLTELDSIAQQIKALESMMGDEKQLNKDDDDGTESQRLDADEDKVTREFLQMLEDEDAINEYKLNHTDIPPLQLEGAAESKEGESKAYLADLGKNLGCVVQTRDGGYLAAMNPLDTEVSRKETPKLAMQISRPYILPSNESSSGFELFQAMASIGLDGLNSQILSLMSMDELMGKTAEQVAFEGIASAIIHGRNKEGASSSAARAIAAVKIMATAMNSGRKERISTGIWNLSENSLTAEEILALSLQKIESMAIEALKIQAEMAEEDAPFDVSPLNPNPNSNQAHPLASSVPLEDYTKSSKASETLTMAVGIQLRDPIRRHEAVGGPMIALIYANPASEDDKPNEDDDEEMRFKVRSLHVGGLKVRTTRGKRSVWDSEKQRLTAMQWLVSYGIGKAAKKTRQQNNASSSSKGQDLLWSISSRVMADMWLKSIRNPDVKFPK